MCTSPFCFRHAHSGPLGALEKLYEIRYKERKGPLTLRSHKRKRAGNIDTNASAADQRPQLLFAALFASPITRS